MKKDSSIGRVSVFIINWALKEEPHKQINARLEEQEYRTTFDRKWKLD